MSRIKNMFNEIMKNLEDQLPGKEIEKLKNKELHLGIFSEPFLTYMLEGKKTIESRITKNKVSPYQKITKEDVVFIKKSSGPVLGFFTIKEVLFFDLATTPIETIKENYNKQLCVDETFWKNKSSSRYATLMIIDKLIKLKPFSIPKKGMQTWIKLKK